MKDKHVHTFNTISEFHEMSGFPKPHHPQISLVDYGQVKYQTDETEIRWLQNFYSVGLKRNISGKFKYGQQQYDFDEGLMSFVAPQQLVHIEVTPYEDGKKPSGWLLLIHPDFLWNTPLARAIKQYEFFGYAINEALFLSDKEEKIIVDIMLNIQREYDSNIDKFSQDIIISQIEVLLNYTRRFYERQFLTRKIPNHQILTQLEMVLDSCMQEGKLLQQGLPTVQQVARELNLSPNYLSSMLTVLTGHSTQQHIHNKLIAKAKEKLSTTSLSISEIAYELGFEHPASFTKLFKAKTNQSPNAFRNSFN
jgi:AraC family transcriptional activator of pobA